MARRNRLVGPLARSTREGPATASSLEGPEKHGSLLRRSLWAAAVCLLLSGCSTVGGSSGGATGRWNLLPGPLVRSSDERAFARAVENDPFPRASQGHLRAEVRP